MGELLTPTHLILVAVIAFVLYADQPVLNLKLTSRERSVGGKMAGVGIQTRTSDQSSRKEPMVDIILLLMAIASAVSLLVVSPRDLQRKAILAWREYKEMELSHAHDRGEDGQAVEIPINSRSGSHPLS